MNSKDRKPSRTSAAKVVRLSPIKGRPLLTWVGKCPLSKLRAYPAQQIERFELDGAPKSRANWSSWPRSHPREGLLFHGDNLEVLSNLLSGGFGGAVKFVYIDPPFDSGADYVRKVRLRVAEGDNGMQGNGPSIGEQIQYTDIWADDKYLQFMHDRLVVLRELLADDGFIAVHMNSARVHYVKVIMDEIFGAENFRNDIIVRRIRKSYVEANGATTLNEGVDYLLLYSNGMQSRLHTPMRNAPKQERYHSFDAPGDRPNLAYELFGHRPPYGRHWMRSEAEVKRMIAKDDLRANPNTGWPEYRLPAVDQISRDSLWDDITASAFKTGYPTEKKEQMLEILIGMTTEPGDLVLDSFCGSGTTMAVAQKLGRRWIGCDINKGSVQTTTKRVQGVIQQQLTEERKRKQPLIVDSGEEITPAQFGFSVFRVNSYDLTIQHKEAVELACEHMGVVRNRAGRYFDGTLDDRIVKIAALGHPLTPLALQELETELKSRPGEDRDIVIVCLGAELQATKWVEKYNRVRRKGGGSNRVEIVDLRTHPEYGQFFAQHPPTAKTKIRRAKGKIVVEVVDFCSPSVMERIKQQPRLLLPKIDDCRVFIDSIMIDPEYDGKVFTVRVNDIPSGKTDLVAGHYEIEAPKGRTRVAVKITDVLGEEVLVTASV